MGSFVSVFEEGVGFYSELGWWSLHIGFWYKGLFEQKLGSVRRIKGFEKLTTIDRSHLSLYTYLCLHPQLSLCLEVLALVIFLCHLDSHPLLLRPGHQLLSSHKPLPPLKGLGIDFF